MTKVEAVVIRERIETVIDAVEEETGHVGVTVIEAVGHGRERGVTHEYRGRVFESRFLPKALLIFVVDDEKVDAVVAAIAAAAHSGNESGDGLVWSTPDRQRHPQPNGSAAWRRWKSDDRSSDQESGSSDRGEHDLGRRHGGPRDVHAGGLRVPRGRA